MTCQTSELLNLILGNSNPNKISAHSCIILKYIFYCNSYLVLGLGPHYLLSYFIFTGELSQGKQTKDTNSYAISSLGTLSPQLHVFKRQWKPPLTEYCCSILVKVESQIKSLEGLDAVQSRVISDSWEKYNRLSQYPQV